MNSDDYFKKLDDIVFTNKFVELSVSHDPKQHPVVKTEKSIQYYINRYIKPHVDLDIYKSILPTGCRPGAIYGLAKVHKQDIPLRPVISMLNTPQYGLAKYLHSVIQPCIPSGYMLKSTSDFIEKLKDIELCNSANLVSFDVESLFTNVPLDETINLAVDYVYSEESRCKPQYDRRHFKKLLCFATSGEFIYRDRLFRQVDGVAMGSPLGPTLANLFLAHYERQWQNHVNAPSTYLRYVDDLFCIFTNGQDYNNFLEYLNTRHPNLKFTTEIGHNKLPFLDVSVEIQGDSFIRSVHRKLTHTGLMLNFNAFCPLQWKRSVICGCLYRAFSICSSRRLFDFEVSNLRRLFEMNGYPIPFFNDILSSFLRKVHEPRIQSCNESDVYTLCLPYFGNVSETFILRFRRFCRRYNLKIRIVYKPFKVGHYFSLKSVCPKFLESCVVYKYTCPVDQASYVGKTRRHLIQRINEHRNSEQSAIYNHNVLCHCLTPKNFEILKQCRGDFELSLTEALLIKKERPTLNASLANQGSSVFLKLF